MNEPRLYARHLRDDPPIEETAPAPMGRRRFFARGLGAGLTALLALFGLGRGSGEKAAGEAWTEEKGRYGDLAG